MSDQGSLIPVSDEQAKAIREAIKALRDAGAFLGEIFGAPAKDLVGYLGGDWLRVQRAENLARVLEKARARLKERNKTAERLSLSVSLPLLIEAAEESRDELQEIWARLLAAAADATRSRSFRAQFIEIAKQLDPLDAAVLSAVEQKGGAVSGGTVNEMTQQLKASRDEIEVSLENLLRLGLVGNPGNRYLMKPFGREFLRAISD